MSMKYGERGADASNIGAILGGNWIPLSLIGAGVAWLVANGLVGVFNHQRVQRTGRRIAEFPGDIGIDNATRRDTGHAAPIIGPDGLPLPPSNTTRGNGWVTQATDAARETIGSVREAGTAVLEQTSRYTDYAGEVSDTAKRATGHLVEKFQHEPWIVGIAGMLTGAALAVMLPPTRIEADYLADARHQLWTKASELGHQAADSVRGTASSSPRPGFAGYDD